MASRHAVQACMRPALNVNAVVTRNTGTTQEIGGDPRRYQYTRIGKI